MGEDIAGPQGASSRPMWETLEGMVREKAQEFIQQIMEEEVTELLGREKSERRGTVDSARGLPQRIWQAEAVGDELGHDHTPTPSGSGRRGAVRESGAAVVREAGRRSWALCFRSCICTDWRRETSSWRCGDC